MRAGLQEERNRERSGTAGGATAGRATAGRATAGRATAGGATAGRATAGRATAEKSDQRERATEKKRRLDLSLHTADHGASTSEAFMLVLPRTFRPASLCGALLVGIGVLAHAQAAPDTASRFTRSSYM